MHGLNMKMKVLEYKIQLFILSVITLDVTKAIRVDLKRNLGTMLTLINFLKEAAAFRVCSLHNNTRKRKNAVLCSTSKFTNHSTLDAFYNYSEFAQRELNIFHVTCSAAHVSACI